MKKKKKRMRVCYKPPLLMILPAALPAAFCIPSVVAQQPRATGAQVTAQDDEADRLFDALVKELDESGLGPVEAYNTFKPKFEQFAAEHRGTEAEAQATLWLISQTWWLRSEGTMSETAIAMTEDLLKRHPKSKHLDLLVDYQYVFTKEQRKDLFNRLLEDSPHKNVQAAGHFGLARMESARNEDGEPNGHYQALLDAYADFKWNETTYGKMAAAYLNPHPKEALEIGATAPEIEGTNQDGKPMKLSDARGTVIMLDFWGHW